jgi:L-fucose mutarotase
MGHGDEIVIADANFPAETVAKRLIRVPGIDAVSLCEAILEVFPLDSYSDYPAALMDLTDSDKKMGMPVPGIWAEYEEILSEASQKRVEIELMERYAFYERAQKAFAVIQTGEEKQYGNLILVKGVIL